MSSGQKEWMEGKDEEIGWGLSHQPAVPRVIKCYSVKVVTTAHLPVCLPVYCESFAKVPQIVEAVMTKLGFCFLESRSDFTKSNDPRKCFLLNVEEVEVAKKEAMR